MSTQNKNMSKREYAATSSKSKAPRTKKHERAEFWKRAKNVALHVQSRRENHFTEETLLPRRTLSRRDQRYESYMFTLTHTPLLQKCPLGPGW